MNHKEKQRSCPQLDANKHLHTHISNMGGAQNPEKSKSRHVKFWLNFDILLTLLKFAKIFILLFVFDYINLIKTKSTY